VAAADRAGAAQLEPGKVALLAAHRLVGFYGYTGAHKYFSP
jgi:hypothetical protein